MRLVVGLLGLLGLTVAAPARADTLADFEATWPAAAKTMRDSGFEAELRTGVSVCRYWEPTTAPPLTDETFTSVSPDGETLVIAISLEYSDSRKQQLGLVAPANDSLGEYGPVLVGVHGPDGVVWAVPLMTFPNCLDNRHTFTWRDDRVLVDADSGHGTRVSLVDTGRHIEIAGSFAASFVVSPEQRHLAHLFWTSGYPDHDTDQPMDDDLSIDAQVVSGDRPGTRIGDVRWRSERVLEWCQTWKGASPHLHRAKQTKAGRWKVKRAGKCKLADDTPHIAETATE
jgi:hypothetical protein